jgi:hypothetical protein
VCRARPKLDDSVRPTKARQIGAAPTGRTPCVAGTAAAGQHARQRDERRRSAPHGADHTRAPTNAHSLALVGPSPTTPNSQTHVRARTHAGRHSHAGTHPHTRDTQTQTTLPQEHAHTVYAHRRKSTRARIAKHVREPTCIAHRVPTDCLSQAPEERNGPKKTRRMKTADERVRHGAANAYAL